MIGRSSLEWIAARMHGGHEFALEQISNGETPYRGSGWRKLIDWGLIEMTDEGVVLTDKVSALRAYMARLEKTKERVRFVYTDDEARVWVDDQQIAFVATIPNVISARRMGRDIRAAVVKHLMDPSLKYEGSKGGGMWAK